MAGKHGYVASDIYEALASILRPTGELMDKPDYLPSAREIRKCIKELGLGTPVRRAKHQVGLYIPKSKIEELVKHMNIPMEANELIDILEENELRHMERAEFFEAD